MRKSTANKTIVMALMATVAVASYLYFERSNASTATPRPYAAVNFAKVDGTRPLPTEPIWKHMAVDWQDTQLGK